MIFTGSHDGTICVYDINPLTHIDTLCEHTAEVQVITLTNSEKYLVSSSDNSLKVWCTATLSCIRTVFLTSVPSRVAGQQGDVVAVSFGDHTKLFKFSTLQDLGQIPSESNNVALSPCGRWVFAPCGPSVRVCAVCDVMQEGST
eukprot:TRINITY_DN16665_c0_g1_i1.p1 TRINITY_DN16665_c0_g1~~TRINITY_DN16665_c0_g1_i1.p1  ORF type:complete len:156 (+),score=31.92 TRINITY_DN16665_c0_g1_i1:38-469(+)